MRAGGVVSAQVQRHEDTKRSKGWGLAEFITSAAALNAISMLDKTSFNGRHVHLRLDRRISEESADSHSSIFVGNVQWAVTQQELIELFAPYRALDCTILTNMYGRSKGFAIIKFPSEADAAAAINALNHTDFHGRNLEVSCNNPIY
jgi:RNA recognition motif-containing protein